MRLSAILASVKPLQLPKLAKSGLSVHQSHNTVTLWRSGRSETLTERERNEKSFVIDILYCHKF